MLGYLITAPHFCAGIVLYEGYADRCAPILKYMYGWEQKKIEDYCTRKGWKWELI